MQRTQEDDISSYESIERKSFMQRKILNNKFYHLLGRKYVLKMNKYLYLNYITFMFSEKSLDHFLTDAKFVLQSGLTYILGNPEVTANITANHATFPIRIRKITVQICGNFWVTQ